MCQRFETLFSSKINKSEKAGCKVLEAGDNKPTDAHVTTNVEWLQVARHAIGSVLGCLDYSSEFYIFFLNPTGKF